SLAMALYFLKWTENFSPETVEPSTISEFKKGINLVILGSIIDFIPNIHIIITYIGLISVVLYVIGFWKIGKTIITEFGMGQMGDINLDATPDMYSGLGPSLYSPSSSINSYDYGSGESSSEQKWDGQLYQSSSLCPYCGAPKVEIDAEFCATCGKKIR
ncbi:MAG: zinc ribbon domain-containing protein, partial [Promethearchaeota archaeon]